MGCFLGCFGRRKNRLRRRRSGSFQPRLNRFSEGSTKDNHLKLRVPTGKEVTKVSERPAKDDHFRVSTVKEVIKVSEGAAKDDHLNFKVPNFDEIPKLSVIPITDICDKGKENLSPSPTRKRVTFDSNVKTYEHIVVEESIELFEEVRPEEKTLKSSQAPCSSDGSDITSNSSGSYPSNHRYQNCRESDDEEEDVTDCGESDLEDSDDEDNVGLLHDEDYYNDNYEDKLQNWDKKVYTEEIADNVLDTDRIEEKSKASARDRSGYVNAVLNPIENLSQWKAVKSKERRITDTQSRKENAKQRSQEVAVDASLSTWLTTSQTTTSGCSSVSTATSENKYKSSYPKVVQSHDERPILCALTAEEIKQFSAKNSPRKSPSRSPESPIIGTVGGYWNSQSIATRNYREV